jgi:iron complex transport system ATP-binding protein
VTIPPQFEAVGLRAGPGDFLRNLGFRIPSGGWTCIVGPNGSGKTTLLKTLTGLLPYSGELRFRGIPVHQIPRKQFAQQVAVVPQGNTPVFGFRVEEFVASGRFPHQSWYPRGWASEHLAVARALEQTGLTQIRSRKITELSLGEFQRVTLARALAQEAPVLILDEPNAFLDLSHQVQIFELLARLQKEEHRTILCVCHDLQWVAEFASHVLLMRSGELIAQGAVEEALTEEALSAAYSVPIQVQRDPQTGRTSFWIPRFTSK